MIAGKERDFRMHDIKTQTSIQNTTMQFSKYKLIHVRLTHIAFPIVPLSQYTIQSEDQTVFYCKLLEFSTPCMPQ